MSQTVFKTALAAATWLMFALAAQAADFQTQCEAALGADDFRTGEERAAMCQCYDASVQAEPIAVESGAMRLHLGALVLAMAQADAMVDPATLPAYEAALSHAATIAESPYDFSGRHAVSSTILGFLDCNVAELSDSMDRLKAERPVEVARVLGDEAPGAPLFTAAAPDLAYARVSDVTPADAPPVIAAVDLQHAPNGAGHLVSSAPRAPEDARADRMVALAAVEPGERVIVRVRRAGEVTEKVFD